MIVAITESCFTSFRPRHQQVADKYGAAQGLLYREPCYKGLPHRELLERRVKEREKCDTEQSDGALFAD